MISILLGLLAEIVVLTALIVGHDVRRWLPFAWPLKSLSLKHVLTRDWETRSATVYNLLKEEDYPEASKSAQTLTRDFPDRWEGWFWLGTAQLAQDQMDAAGSSLERASKLNPKVARAWRTKVSSSCSSNLIQRQMKLRNTEH